jgi:integrase
VKGVRRIGVRLGNWLTAEQGKRLLERTNTDSLRGLRNYAILAVLIGCGLRRGELLGLHLASVQSRGERWVIADLLGKAGHIRTVPIPGWVKTALEKWTEASDITDGALFRSIDRNGRVWGTGMTPKVLWEIVKVAAARADIPKLAPHDLRRTCATLPSCRWRARPDSVSPGTRLDPNHRALPGMQAEAAVRSQRQDGNRTLEEPLRNSGRLTRPFATLQVLSRDATIRRYSNAPGALRRVRLQYSDW